MKIRKICAVVASVIAISGCATSSSEVPIAKNFPSSNQLKLQAASHWNVIAADLASKLKTNMEGKVSKSDGLYVSSVHPTPFNHAVEVELISSLISDGYTVYKTPSNATKVDIDTQVVQFSANRIKPSTVGVPTALVAGVWALSAIDATAAGVASAAIITADVSRWFNSGNASGPTPKTEIIVSITVSDKDKYLALSKNIYYVTDSDVNLYEAAQFETKRFSVIGDY